MKQIVLILTLAAFVARGQEKKTEEPKPQVPMVQKIIEVKHADVQRLWNLLSALPATIRADPALRVLAVSGSKETVAAIEEAVKKLDVPPTPQPNIELTVYMLYASGKTDAGAEPAELAPAIKQLRALFQYKGYRVLETLIMRGRDGQNGDTRGRFLWPVEGVGPDRSDYQFDYRSASLSTSGNSRVVRIDRLNLGVTSHSGRVSGRINTDVDVREGQKVVVGKSNISGSDDALILVVTAKVVE